MRVRDTSYAVDVVSAQNKSSLASSPRSLICNLMNEAERVFYTLLIALDNRRLLSAVSVCRQCIVTWHLMIIVPWSPLIVPSLSLNMRPGHSISALQRASVSVLFHTIIHFLYPLWVLREGYRCIHLVPVSWHLIHSWAIQTAIILLRCALYARGRCNKNLVQFECHFDLIWHLY